MAADKTRHPGDAEFLPPLQRSRLLWLLAERGVGRRCRGRASSRVPPLGTEPDQKRRPFSREVLSAGVYHEHYRRGINALIDQLLRGSGFIRIGPRDSTLAI